MKGLYTILLVLFTLFTFAQGGPPTTSTILDGNWSNSAIWSNGIPTQNENATINNVVSLDVSGDIKNLTINGTLTNNGYLLRVVNFINNGTYTDNSGTVEIRQNGIISGNDTYFYNLNAIGGSISNIIFVRNLLSVSSGLFNVTGGTLTLVNNGIYDGRIGTSLGSINGSFIWQKYINKSCTGWSMYSFPTNATLAEIGLFYTFGWWKNTYSFDESVLGLLEDGWVPYTSAAIGVVQGQGIMHYNNPFSDVVSLNINLVNNVTIPVTYNSTGIVANDGWNLVGNPHPGTIDWDNINWTKINVADAIYSWSNCNGNYGSYVGGLGTGGMDGNISSGESFWIQTIGTTPSLIAPKSVIIDGSEVMYKMSSSPDNYVRLNYGGDDIIIRLNNGSPFFDYDEDAIKLGDRLIYTTDDDGVQYSIDSRYASQLEQIPLWTISSGYLILDENELNGYHIYIYDKLMESYSSLTNQVWLSGNSQFSNRYNIIFSRSPIKSKKIYLKEVKLGKSYIDMTGREIRDPKPGRIYIDPDNGHQKVYIVE